MDNFNDYQILITRAREYEINESIQQTPAKKYNCPKKNIFKI